MGSVMRILVDVRKEDGELLVDLAWRNHRTPREQASFLLSTALQAEREHHDPTDEPVARAS